MTSADNIKKKIEQLNYKSTDKMRSRILSEASKAMEQTINASADKPGVWRIIMRSKISKLAVAAVIVIAVLIGVEFIGGPSTTGIVFAEVLEYINSFGYTFDLTTVADKKAFDAVHAMVLEPGKMRMNTTVGLGKISTILDVAEGKSMILFHQFKTAQIQEMPTMLKDYGAEGILFLCTESIVNLWDMQDGTEEQLGEKEIDGETAIGFKVVQEGQYLRSEINIWADAQTAVPVLVEMSMFTLDDSKDAIGFIMNKFDLAAQLDEELFSLKVPSGYTLAYQYSLDELDKKTERSDQAEKIVQALEIWSQGNKTQAVETLLAIDWTRPIEFSGEPYLFSMTEKEYVSLKPNDQQKAMTDVMAMSSTIKKITMNLLTLGQTAMLAQDHKKAERYFQTALQFGKLLTRDPDAILIVRLVGIAVERKTLSEMVILYTQTNQREKLEAAQKELQVMKVEIEKIKDKARGL